jgi:hypothetical protein
MNEENINLKYMYVHEDLVREFQLFKEELERLTGYPVKGGNPVISKLVANILKQRREQNIKNIQLEVHKVKGVKKSEIFFL